MKKHKLIKRFLLFLLPIFFVSCKTENNHSEELINKIKLLEDKISKKQMTNNFLEEENLKLKEGLNQLQKQLDQYDLNLISNKDLKFLINKNYFDIINKNNLIKYFYDELEEFYEDKDYSNEKTLHSFLWDGCSFSLHYTDSSYYNYFTHIFSRLQKNPKEIKKFLNSENKKYLYSIIDKNIYKNIGVELFVKSLTLTYEQNIGENKKMENLFNEALKYNSLEEDENNTAIELASSYQTDEFRELFFKENINNTDETYNSNENEVPSDFTFYVYSFWARRFNEKSEVYVYEFLKELDENLE